MFWGRNRASYEVNQGPKSPQCSASCFWTIGTVMTVDRVKSLLSLKRISLYHVTPSVSMGFPIKFDTVKSGWSIVYTEE